jgi:GntR family transcriptional repressor for pyruvate dehydrogenase complex
MVVKESKRGSMSLKKPFSQLVKKQTLAEQVAESIQESILNGDLAPGEALPTEPELSEVFGVSRAVIRDATRMLAAQGLVVAQHGRGVFVTESQGVAFGEALLLALRRMGATVWDVETFEQLIYPEVAALAAAEVTDDELVEMQALADKYIVIYREVWLPSEADAGSPSGNPERSRQAFLRFMASIFNATHNAILQLLAMPLLELHSTRDWDSGEEESITYEEAVVIEQAVINNIVDTIASRDPDYARKMMRQLMQLPEEAEASMRETPVGETLLIPLSLGRWTEQK